LAVIASATVVACGGSEGGGGEAAEKPSGPPPAKEVQATVSTILDQCISASFDPEADTGAVSKAVDSQIRFFKEYDADAQLAPSDLKARTMREVLEQSRDNLQECKPEEVDRISGTLTSK